MIISVVYLLVRCPLGCLTVPTRRTQGERDMRNDDRHLRREVLDRLLIVNEHHLRRVLTEFLRHYNTARHRSLGQLTPAQADSQPPEQTPRHGIDLRNADPQLDLEVMRAHPLEIQTLSGATLTE